MNVGWFLSLCCSVGRKHSRVKSSVHKVLRRFLGNLWGEIGGKFGVISLKNYLNSFRIYIHKMDKIFCIVIYFYIPPKISEEFLICERINLAMISPHTQSHSTNAQTSHRTLRIHENIVKKTLTNNFKTGFLGPNSQNPPKFSNFKTNPTPLLISNF